MILTRTGGFRNDASPLWRLKSRQPLPSPPSRTDFNPHRRVSQPLLRFPTAAAMSDQKAKICFVKEHQASQTGRNVVL
jgi:hypothetical protein